MIKEQSKQSIAITADGWTSKAHHSYLGITGHYINADWVLKSYPIGIGKKIGRSQAEDYLHDLEDAITQYKLVYSDMASCTTDTEPVMVKLGRLIKEKARSARSDDISMDHHGL